MTSKKILIIEDEKNLARFVSLELEHEGYATEIKDNGRSGLEEATSKDYDLILLDLMLPELDGFEVARRLRKEKDTPIIMMTARDSTMDRVAGLDIGLMIISLNLLRLRNFWRVFVLSSVVKSMVMPLNVLKILLSVIL